MEWNFYFGFNGRVSRARCWRVMLLNSFSLVMFMLIVWINVGVSVAHIAESWRAPLLYTLMFGILGPAFIISMWCFAAIGIKRLHDRDRTGWWMVPFFIVPALLGKVPDGLLIPSAVVAISLVSAGFSLWGFVEVFCLRGTGGPNRFGSDPLARGNISIATGSRAAA